MIDAANRFGLAFPLTIHATAESVRVLDRAGVTADYVYISEEPERRQQTRRVSREQGIEIARIIAGRSRRANHDREKEREFGRGRN